VTEWTLHGVRLNLLDTLSRRPEPYHAQLKATARNAARPAGVCASASIRELLGVKEAHLAQRLVYDDHRRSAFLDYGLAEMPSVQDLVSGAMPARRRFWNTAPFAVERRRGGPRAAPDLSVAMIRDASGLRLRKVLRLEPDRPCLECLYEVAGGTVPVVGLELNLALRDERYLSRPEQVGPVSSLTVAEEAVGVELRLAVDPPAMVVHFPVETVSESEGGLERTYQGLCLVCLWQLSAGGRAWQARVRVEVEESASARRLWGNPLFAQGSRLTARGKRRALHAKTDIPSSLQPGAWSQIGVVPHPAGQKK
jgi:alpha-amylase